MFVRYSKIFILCFLIGWLFLACQSDDSESEVPAVVISGTVMDEGGQPLSDVHIHLIYLFETSISAPILPTPASQKASPTSSAISDDEYDLGDFDLPYLTAAASGGGPAHRISGIAWLGSGISGETEPNIPDNDGYDDGVQLLELFLEDPCPTAVLRIEVFAGPNYTQQPLYLNIWIDGNDDGDFDDDSLCSGLESSEWWIRNREDLPGIMLDTLLMPAVNMTMGDHRAVRVRLSMQVLDRTGYQGVDEGGGEVEDHWLGLETPTPVDLIIFRGEPGNEFCRLIWSTASETGNHYFSIGRSTSNQGPFLRIGTVPGRGTALDTTDYAYADCGVFNNIPYYYKLTAVDYGGENVDLEPIIDLTASEEYPGPPPGQFYPIYPNPGSEVHIPFELECSRLIHLVVESADFESIDTLWSGIPPQVEYEVSWNGEHRPNGLFVARVMTSGDDLGERYFFFNRDDPQVLSSMEALYNTGTSGSFTITMNRAKWGMSFQGRDEDNNPINVTLSDQVVVVATKTGYATAWDTVTVSPDAAAQVELIIEPQ